MMFYTDYGLFFALFWAAVAIIIIILITEIVKTLHATSATNVVIFLLFLIFLAKQVVNGIKYFFHAVEVAVELADDGFDLSLVFFGVGSGGVFLLACLKV